MQGYKYRQMQMLRLILKIMKISCQLKPFKLSSILFIKYHNVFYKYQYIIAKKSLDIYIYI